jgi:hypothetical protein
MKEIEGLPGIHISDACRRLVESAPAFMTFNGIRLESGSGVTAGDLEAIYHAEMERLRAKHEAEREAFEATAEGQRTLAKAKAAQDAEDARHKESLAQIERSGVRIKYPWAEGMREISGFGGDYESACRDMLYAGISWLDVHPGADIKATTYRNVFGLLNPESDDAKHLDKIVCDACPGCSGAMHHAVMSACIYISRNGWGKYVEAMCACNGHRAPSMV